MLKVPMTHENNTVNLRFRFLSQNRPQLEQLLILKGLSLFSPISLTKNPVFGGSVI